MRPKKIHPIFIFSFAFLLSWPVAAQVTGGSNTPGTGAGTVINTGPGTAGTSGVWPGLSSSGPGIGQTLGQVPPPFTSQPQVIGNNSGFSQQSGFSGTTSNFGGVTTAPIAPGVSSPGAAGTVGTGTGLSSPADTSSLNTGTESGSITTSGVGSASGLSGIPSGPGASAPGTVGTNSLNNTGSFDTTGPGSTQ